MRLGIQCLLAETEVEAATIAQQLHTLNLQRRSIEADMQEGAQLSLDDIAVESQFSISIYQDDWH